MRKRIGGKQLSRDSEHRSAMRKNLAAALFEHGEVWTTMSKAKAVQPFIERLITIAKRGDFAARRQLEARLNDRKIHSWVADPNVKDEKKDNDFFELPDEDDIEFNRYGEVRKAPRLIQHLMTRVATRYADRNGGYTRIIKTGQFRLGDGTEYVVMQLVGEEEGPEIGGGASGRRKQADKRAAFAAKLRTSGGGGTATAVAEPETEAESADQPTAESAGEPEATDAAETEAADTTDEDEKS